MESVLYIKYYRARWIQLGDRILEDGGVVVVSGALGHPRILAVFDPHTSAVPTTDEMIRAIEGLGLLASHQPRKYERLPDQCLGEQALLPGMVNCHTHLEFSDCLIPLGHVGVDFSSWLRTVIDHRIRTSRTAANFSATKATSCANGWREIWESGTVAAGEILSQPMPEPALTDSASQSADTGFCGVVFHEVLGLAVQRAQASWEWAWNCLAQRNPAHVRLGLSPHAPYSTSTVLYRQCAEHCLRAGLPLATHLAESREELQLLRERSGPLVELFRQMGVWQPEQIESRSVRDVLETVVQVPRLLLIHGNYLEQADWQWLRGKNPDATVVYCPQTHDFFQHERHPWVEMANDGIRVALGTDSRASSPSLSLWNDLMMVRQKFPRQNPALLWRMATLHGASALGLEQELGSISPRKLARFCVADLGAPVQRFSWEALLSPNTKIRGLFQ